MEKNVNDTPLSDFVEDNIGYFDGIDGDDEDDEDELDIMKEVAEKILNEDRSFMIGHPQRNTHSAHMKRENHLVVPNFCLTHFQIRLWRSRILLLHHADIVQTLA